MSLGMIAANLFVIAGEWIVRVNGGAGPWYPGWTMGWMLSADAAFLFFVFILPAAVARKANSRAEKSE